MASHVRHDKPASEYIEGYPVGNGVLAAMLLGTVPVERIALNHEWLWRAEGRYRDFEPRHQHLDDIRTLFFEGKTFEAATLANEKLGGLGGTSGTPNRVDAYQPAGDLFLDTGGEQVSEYKRELDLSTGIAAVHYTVNDVAFGRECFAHAARKVICVRLMASEPRRLDVAARLSRIEDPDCTLAFDAQKNSIRMVGRFVEGPAFCVLAHVRPTGGSATPDPQNGCCRISGADQLLILLTIAVAHDGEDVETIAAQQLAGVPPEWDALVAEHTQRFAAMYNRVTFDLDLGAGDDSKPADERLAALKGSDTSDNDLVALLFNFGRYLLISSTLMAELPPNLQGKWNEALNPPWQSDLHQDMNLQMNYWPAEVCNLAESTGPLFRHIERFTPHGREMARALYNCRGVWFPIQTDPWGRATPESRGWDVWIGAAAWLAQHMWWRYEWGGDDEFLRERAYPFFKEVAAFYEDYLVRDPQGRLVPVPSQSPENTFVGGTWPVSLCVGATMDFQLIHDLLTHAVAASEILDVDAELRETWRTILHEIPPLQIGRHGQLQEWLDDYEDAEPGHRHFSHLFALYPGDQLTLDGDPDLVQAARVSVLRRLAAGGGHTGWSCAWTACLLARLGDATLALAYLKRLLADWTTSSLLDLHPPRIFQVDGSFGATAAVAEMLLQSHAGTLHLLPALPSTWPEGRVTGLVARGGFEVSITWKDGTLTEAALLARRGGPCTVRYAENLVELETRPGTRYHLNHALRSVGDERWEGP